MKSAIKITALAMLAVVLLVGCDKEELDRLPEGEQPVTLTATMDRHFSAQAVQSATRATADNAWMGGEEVAVQIGSEVKKYAAASGGQLSVTSGGSPFYWTSSAEKKTVSAWTPYSDTKPTSLGVQADQSGEGYQQSDMIYATQEISYASPELEFKHLPVKVVVNLKNGEGVTADEVRNATVSIVNQNLTSGAISAADWSVAQVAPGSSTIIPNTLTTATTDYQKTVQSLLVPQTSTTSKRLIKVAVGGQEFFYSTILDFAAGEQHTYHITVLKSGLSVTTNGAEAWAGSETAVTSKEVAAGFTDKDLKIGDYYYSDGETSDGGYRKYTDNSTSHLPVMPVLTDASGNPRTVIGIVMKVGRDAGGEWVDDCAYKLKDGSADMPTVRGYVFALSYANGGALCTWGSLGIMIGDGEDNIGEGDGLIQGTIEPYEVLGFYGYKFTNIIKKYANDHSLTLQNDFPAAYWTTTAFENECPAPSNSSGWFLPSGAQGRYWISNKVVLLASVGRVTGNQNWLSFWTSSECSPGKAWSAFNSYHGYIEHFPKDNITYNYVRSILAF